MNWVPMPDERGVEHQIRHAPAPAEWVGSVRYLAKIYIELLHLQKEITYTTDGSECFVSRAVVCLVYRRKSDSASSRKGAGRTNYSWRIGLVGEGAWAQRRLHFPSRRVPPD